MSDRRARRRAAALVVVACTCAGALPVTAAAQGTDSALTLSLRLANAGQRDAFLVRLQYNCSLFFSGGFVPQSGGRWAYANVSGAPVGSLNFDRGSGELLIRRGEWQVEQLDLKPKRPVKFAALGLALRGRRAFVTGRVTTGRSYSSGARRVRLAAVRGVKIVHGPLIDRRRRPVASTYATSFTGELTMLPAMSRALERLRCKDLSRNRLSRRFRPGYELGRFVAEFRPDAATGVAGDAVLRVGAFEPVTTEPAADTPTPIVSGLPIPLACVRGDECAPSGGTFSIASGFQLVLRDRRVSVAGLSVAINGPRNDLRQTITGTLDGAPVTVAEGSSFTGVPFTQDFNQRAAAALGAAPDEMGGSIEVTPRFTTTGPPGA